MINRRPDGTTIGESEEHIDLFIRTPGKGYYIQQACSVTVATWNEECLFGSIYRDQMVLNDFGEIVRMEWLRISDFAANIRTVEFVVMPNHLHGLLILTTDGKEPGSAGISSALPARRDISTPRDSESSTSVVSAFIRRFKASVVNRISHRNGIARDRIWQKDYHERVIHSRSELENVRDSIRNNPRNWWQDELRPRIYTDV